MGRRGEVRQRKVQKAPFLCCFSVKATHDLLEKITDLFDFVECLKWPDEDFRSHLETRVVRIAADTVESLAEK